MCWDNSSRPPSSPRVASQPMAAEVSPQATFPVYGFHQQALASPWQQLPSQYASLFKAPLRQQQDQSFAHLFALKQPLQLLVQQQQPSIRKASRPGDSLSCEPSAKRLAIDLNLSLEDIDEGEESEDVTLELPDECIAQIFGNLEAVKDRMACALVCRRWLHVLSVSKKVRPVEQVITRVAPAKQPALSVADSADVVTGLSRTVEGRGASDARLMAMAVALSDKGGLEKLVVRRSKRTQDGKVSSPLPLTASGFQAIAQASPKLRALSIWDCEWLDDETISVVARNCRLLEKLDIMNCPKMSDKALTVLARFCPKLSVLSIASSRLVSDQGLQVLARGCQALLSLSLTSCPLVVGKGVGILVSSCKKLSALKLAGGMGLTDEGFKFIGQHGAGLTRLRLCQLKRLSETGFMHLGTVEGFKNISCLSVAACCGLTSAALEVIGRGCTGLKSMGLVGCSSVSDDGLLAFIQNAHGLEALSLQMLPGISNEAAKFSLEYGKHLKALTISSCPGVKDSVSGAADWAIRCPDLSSLKVTHCAAVGDQCLTSIGKAASTLSSLDLCGLPLAGDKGVMAFLASSTKKLSSIDLSGCNQVSDKAISAVAERCGGNMRTLCLDGCTRVTDKGLRALAKECSAMEDLDLSKCDITDRGLKVLLAAVGHSLVNLSLAGCTRITDKSIEEVMESCQSLSGLNLKNCTGLSKKSVERLRQQAVNLFGPTCLFIDP